MLVVSKWQLVEYCSCCTKRIWQSKLLLKIDVVRAKKNNFAGVWIRYLCTLYTLRMYYCGHSIIFSLSLYLPFNSICIFSFRYVWERQLKRKEKYEKYSTWIELVVEVEQLVYSFCNIVKVFGFFISHGNAKKLTNGNE